MADIKDRIRQYLETYTGKPPRLQDVMKALQIPLTERKSVRRIMRELQVDGHLALLRTRAYVSSSPRQTISGILKVSRRGFGFLVPDIGEGLPAVGDIYISRKRMGEAMNGDRVRVRLVVDERRRGEKSSKLREGQVVEVLEHGTTKLVGAFYPTRSGGNVIPRDERLNRTIATPRPDPDLQVADGDLVVAEITAWTHPTEPLIGRVVERLGTPGDQGLDITVLIRDAGVEPEFSEEVLEEVAEIPDAIPPEEISRRTDFRNIVTFTMDGATAKDFDDALSIERLDEGMVRLGVHIADVSYYVKEGTGLDADAFERATSIYPIDRVVPMLPEKLSNNLCSLRPNEDRLTMSCLMTIDEKGRVHDYSIHEGVIRSAHRLIYEEVQTVVDGGAEPKLARALGGIRVQLDELYKLRKILTDMRARRGALDLDVPETEILFDEQGKVKGITRRPRLESHRVVEECMLIANEVVAAHLLNLQVPSVYRVHEDPDLDKLRQLMPVLAQLGVKFPAKKELGADAIQSALDQSAKLETGFISRRLILRAMARAHYSEENVGHYGLASTCYTHFTSPIRRYPDLLVHRFLRETAAHGAPTAGRYRPPVFGGAKQSDPFEGHHSKYLPRGRQEYLAARLPSWTKHCSEQERRAEDIEYDAAKVKSLEYMKQFIGQEFDGYIIGVMNFGMFVELIEMPVEGLLHVRQLTTDFFEYDEDRMNLVGRETGETYKLGDKLRIYVENVSVESLELDFALAEKYVAAGSAERRTEAGTERVARQKRHEARKPRSGGFQARGGKRGRR
ncbi:MAG: ribonuclease R family protein [Candidatus Sumerlaeaceae bacterium]